MKLPNRISAICISLLIVASMAFSQEDVLRPHGERKKTGGGSTEYLYRRSPFTLGIEGGINFNMFSQDIIWEKDPNTGQDYVQHGTIFDGLGSATGISPHVGIFAGFDFSSTIGVLLRLAYDNKYVNKSLTGTDYSYNAISGFTEHPMKVDVSMNASYLSFTPLLKIQATPDLFFTVGPTLQFLLGDVETKWSPTVTDNSAFLNEFLFWQSMGFGSTYSETITIKDAGSDSVAYTPRLGLEAGIGYKIPISNNIFIVPQIRYQLMLTNVLTDTYFYVFPIANPTNQLTVEQSQNKMMHSLQLALALWFDL
jgi:hypothetical protein